MDSPQRQDLRAAYSEVNREYTRPRRSDTWEPTNAQGRMLAWVGLLLIVGIPLLIVFFPKSSTRNDPKAVADRFLTHLADDDADLAFAECAVQFRRARTPAMLILQARQFRLSGVADCSWEEAEVSQDRALLEGTVKTGESAVIRLVLQLVKEHDQWRVLSWALASPQEEQAEQDP